MCHFLHFCIRDEDVISIIIQIHSIYVLLTNIQLHNHIYDVMVTTWEIWEAIYHVKLMANNNRTLCSYLTPTEEARKHSTQLDMKLKRWHFIEGFRFFLLSLFRFYLRPFCNCYSCMLWWCMILAWFAQGVWQCGTLFLWWDGSWTKQCNCYQCDVLSTVKVIERVHWDVWYTNIARTLVTATVLTITDDLDAIQL